MYLHKTEEKIKKCRDAEVYLEVELGREPLASEIAEETGLAVEEVVEFLNFKLEEEEENDFQLRIKATVKNYELEKARGNIPQRDFAKKIGISYATYSQIECCRYYPSDHQQKKISDTAGFPVNKLFPEWLKIFSRKWNQSERSKIVPINKMQISSPDILFLPSNDYEEMQRETDNSLVRKTIDSILDDLTPKEREILKRRAGFYGSPESLEEVGRFFGVSNERIRQLEAKANEKMRDHKDSFKLEEYFNAI